MKCWSEGLAIQQVLYLSVTTGLDSGLIWIHKYSQSLVMAVVLNWNFHFQALLGVPARETSCEAWSHLGS